MSIPGTSGCGSRSTAGSGTTRSRRRRRRGRTRSWRVPRSTGPTTRPRRSGSFGHSPTARPPIRDSHPAGGQYTGAVVEPPPPAEVILVVDDDRDIARFVEVNLQLHGFEVLVAHDGEQALALVQERKPDLAVVDIRM